MVRHRLIVVSVVAVGIALSGCAGGANSSDQSPEIVINDGDGSVAFGEGSTLPPTWPTDLPAPDGIRLQSVVDSDARTVALYLGPGDATRIGSRLESDLRAAGYERQNSTTEGSETLTKYLKNATEVEVSVGQTGSDASITMSVTRLP